MFHVHDDHVQLILYSNHLRDPSLNTIMRGYAAIALAAGVSASTSKHPRDQADRAQAVKDAFKLAVCCQDLRWISDIDELPVGWVF